MTESGIRIADPAAPAEVLAIGTEVVIGRIQDTNSSWLAQRLTEAGARVERITAVADDPGLLKNVWRDAIGRRASLVLATGGLGPTPDDLTVEVAAAVAGVEIIQHPSVIASYRRRRELGESDPLPPHLYKMSAVPSGSTVFENGPGWAPGFAIRIDETVLACMPGPPSEMQWLWEDAVGPLAARWFGGRTESARVLVTMFESQVSPILGLVMDRHSNSYLKAYVALGSRDVGLPVDVIVRRESGGSALSDVMDTLRVLVEGAGAEIRPWP